MINFFEYTLKIFLCLGVIFYCPVPAGAGMEQAILFGYVSQELFFRYGVMVLFCVSMTQPPLRRLQFVSLPMFFVYLVAAALLFKFPDFARRSLTNLFMGLLLYKCVFEHFDFNKVKSYAWWLGWVLFINLGMCALQANGHSLLFSDATGNSPGPMDKMIGFMRLKVHLGVLASLLSPIIAIYAPAFALCLIPLIFIGMSSSAVLAFVISSLILTWISLPKKISIPVSVATILAGVAFVVLYDMPGGQFGERFKIWEFTVDAALKSSPILGMGLGSFAGLNLQTMQENGLPLGWTWAHNELIQGFYEFGIIGVGLVLCYLARQYKNFFEFKKDRFLQVFFASCVSSVIVSLVHFPLHLPRLSHLIIFFFAGFHARHEYLKNV